MFTGGPSLYRAKKNRHPRVHCFPSSVDATHFAAARTGCPKPQIRRTLPHPRLGFFGVIDERLDLPLLDRAWPKRIRNGRSSWSARWSKIDPATLPRRANIHYFGQRTYASCRPSWRAGTSACCRSRATSHAIHQPDQDAGVHGGRKLIVSTPITDVAEPYGDIVYLGDTPAEFIAACEQALRPAPEERAARQTKMREVLARTSWDATAAAMERADRRRLSPSAEARGRPRATDARSRTIVDRRRPDRPERRLSPRRGRAPARAERPRRRLVPVDRGRTASPSTIAGHIMFSNDPYVHEMYEMLLGDNVHWQDREAWIYSKNVYTRYPFQGALYGLPPR